MLRHAENNLNSEKLLRTSLIDRRTEDNCSAQVNGEPGQVTDVLFDQKLELATTNLREIGILIERPENKASHTKSVMLIKQNVEIDR